jgi:hypothetical protein
MSKSAVTKLFIGGVVAIVAGIFFELIAVWVALATGVITFGGPNVVALNGGSSAWLALGLAIFGFLTMTGGWIAALVSWLGALVNTVQLEDKTWFLLLFVLGLLSFGFVAMVAYVLVGPDGTKRPASINPLATAST